VVLETMSSADFLEFRRKLTGASGLQSHQFRELEVLCGLHEIAGNDYVRRVESAWPGMIDAAPRTLRAAFFDAI
ncbi:tryptophan 2,3-dioxygenase family protein, partial [Proteus mirabilis]|uniref:tryptophan 2,3-dioxygenase family protein n=1 Tax=Proteus mirabilis TaxID=584 RepID=UPI001EF88CCD